MELTSTPKFNPDSQLEEHHLSLAISFVDRDIERCYISSIAMQGWLVSQDGIPQTVLITQFGMILAATGFDYEQPDALIKTGVKDLPYKPGFHIRFSTLCLSVNSAIDVYVDIKTRAERLERLRLGSIDRIRFQPLNGIAKSRYAPILVPALGRSGTTLLMGLLNAHPEIIAPGKYPFEYRQASYFWHAIRILTSPANFSRSMHPDGFEQNNFYQLGYNPYVHGQFYKDFAFDRVAEWHDAVWTASVTNFFKTELDNFVVEVLKDAERRNVRFLAEKVLISPLNELVMNLYSNAKQIFLVRDIRDIFVSAKAFNEKRGRKSFGFERLGEREVLEAWRQSTDFITARHTWSDSRTLFVRYEDLILERTAVLGKVFEFLEVQYTPQLADQIQRDAGNAIPRDVHATTDNPGQSIERWRREMSESEKEFCAKAYAEFFRAFGYPTN